MNNVIIKECATSNYIKFFSWIFFLKIIKFFKNNCFKCCETEFCRSEKFKFFNSKLNTRNQNTEYREKILKEFTIPQFTETSL